MLRSIKSKIFVAHFILIFILLGGLSYKHYYNALDSYIENITTFHTNASASIVRTSSLAISGQNYGNIQLPSFVEELSSNKKLLYAKIVGKSDFSSKDFNAVYDKDTAKVYRNLYPANYERELQEKLDRFKATLELADADKVKINFLIARVNDALNTYTEYMQYKKNNNFKYEALLNKEQPYLDLTRNKLAVSLKTNNKNSGLVSLVFDVSEIVEIRHDIFKDLLIESLVAIVIAIILLNILSNKIVGPLNELSLYMSDDLMSIKTQTLPGDRLEDEIGFLSRKIKILLENMQTKHKIVEQQVCIDGLTGIYNRYKFDKVLDEEMIRIQRYQHPLSMAIIDIDHFKAFNDAFGHLIGDEVLIMLADNVQSQIREIDTFARWGGEEFIILLPETDINDAKHACDNIRANIQKMQHQVAGHITVSIGLTQFKENDTQESLFNRCDSALYEAKAKGRNKVYIL